MKSTLGTKKLHRLLALVGASFAMLVSGCGPAQALQAIDAPLINQAPVTQEPMGRQIKTLTENGMELDFHSFDIVLPGKSENGKSNHLDFASAQAHFKIDRLSLHGVNLDLSAPLDYNGVDRQFDLTLADDKLFFSLDADQQGITYDVKYQAALNSYDESGSQIDPTTQGISRYEYGELDFVISEILTVLGVNSLLPDGGIDAGSLDFDWDQIADSLESIEDLGASRFLWNLPLGEETMPIGLIANEGTLSRVEIPAKTTSIAEQGFFEFHNGIQIRLDANIESAVYDFAPKYEEGEYLHLADSLSLFRKAAKYINRKTFGVNLDIGLRHTESEVAQTEEHFGSEAVEESAYLKGNVFLDFSTTVFGGLQANLEMGQDGVGKNDIFFHTEPNAANDDTDVYLKLGEEVKLKTSTDVFSNLLSTLMDALGDESIQNDTIMRLINSLMSTAKGIGQAVDAFRASRVIQDIEEGHYEHAVSIVKDIRALDNQIQLTLDLSSAAMLGTATVTLDGTPELPLAKLTLNDVGFRADNDAKTTFILSGDINVVPYQVLAVDDPSSFDEMRHIPDWVEQIQAIALNDQLSVDVEGYALSKDTISPISTTATYNGWKYSYGRKEQGVSFKGNIAFDLQNRLGCGEMIFVERKETFINDHVVKVDVTGEEGDDDSDANDYKGSGNHNYMFVDYSSINVTAANGSNVFKSESRKDPDKVNNNPAPHLKGRFSIHSLNGILDVLANFSSVDARFERLGNLFEMGSGTVVGNLMKGQYFGLLGNKIIERASVSSSKAEFVLAAGLIQKNSGLDLSITYADGKPKDIEVSMTMDSGTEIYAKISFVSTSFDSFPWKVADHTSSNYTDFSTVKTLIEYVRDTITLGVVDNDIYKTKLDGKGNRVLDLDSNGNATVTQKKNKTTYHISGSAVLSVLGKDITISIDAFLYMQGTDLKIAATIINNFYFPLVSYKTGTMLFFDSETNYFYLNRSQYVPLSGESTTHYRVSKDNFMANMMKWLLQYILGLGENVVERIVEADSTKVALHGEELITKFNVLSGSSLSAPAWEIGLNVGKLANSSALGNLDATIYGTTAHYSSVGESYVDEQGQTVVEGAKNYNKQSLRRLVGTMDIISIIHAKLDLAIANINESSGAYSNAWDDTSYRHAYGAYIKYSGLFNINKDAVATGSYTAQEYWNNNTYGVPPAKNGTEKTVPD